MATGQFSRRNRKSLTSNTTFLSQRIVLNVGGQRFDTYLGTLTTVPHTRLCWMADKHPLSPEYDYTTGEYFFDRHPGIFNEVLNYYRTGKLHCPTHICASEFSEELVFWGINPQNMESCCWVHYRNHIKNEKSLQTYGEHHESSTVVDVRSGSVRVMSNVCTSKSVVTWKKYKNMIWTILEKPNSTALSKVSVVSATCCFLELWMVPFVLVELVVP